MSSSSSSVSSTSSMSTQRLDSSLSMSPSRASALPSMHSPLLNRVTSTPSQNPSSLPSLSSGTSASNEKPLIQRVVSQEAHSSAAPKGHRPHQPSFFDRVRSVLSPQKSRPEERKNEASNFKIQSGDGQGLAQQKDRFSSISPSSPFSELPKASPEDDYKRDRVSENSNEQAIPSAPGGPKEEEPLVHGEIQVEEFPISPGVEGSFVIDHEKEQPQFTEMEFLTLRQLYEDPNSSCPGRIVCRLLNKGFLSEDGDVIQSAVLDNYLKQFYRERIGTLLAHAEGKNKRYVLEELLTGCLNPDYKWHRPMPLLATDYPKREYELIDSLRNLSLIDEKKQLINPKIINEILSESISSDNKIIKKT